MRRAERDGDVRRLTTADEVEAVIGQPLPMVVLKQIGALDEGCRTVLAHSPIAAFGHRDADGISRTAFAGGTPGFTRVHSPTRFSFSHHGPHAPRGPASFFYLLPGVGEILRINGTVAGHDGTRTWVDVAEAYVHCAQAVLRSRLWQPPAPIADIPAPVLSGDGPLARPGVAGFLAAAPFLALSTWDASGGSDTSPRGDRGPVARILDDRTLVIPDRRGNKRADSLHNLVRDDRLSMAALVPGREGVLTVRGRGAITDDPALLATMALDGTPPHLALLVHVEDAEVSVADAVVRSRLWTPGARPDRGAVPDLMALAGKQLATNAAGAKGTPPAFLLKAIGAVPGIPRLLRLLMDRAYASGLRKEGYREDSGDGSAAKDGRRRAHARRTSATAVRRRAPEREVRVAEVRAETPKAATLVLEDADGGRGRFEFRPGQFFTLTAEIGGDLVRRAYSASSAPGADTLEVTVKLVEGGRFSTHVHRDLRAGELLTVHGPSGSFHAGSGPPAETVLIAAGSGITPMMSMIRARLADLRGRDRMALLYSSRTPDEILFAAQLARLAGERPDRLSVTHVLTERDGRLDAAGVRRWISGLSPARDAHYYTCGPGPLMDTVKVVLTELGIRDGYTHREDFASALETGGAATVPREMTVEQDGRPPRHATVEPGRTLLDAGLAAGLPMPYSCTVGNCGDCALRLRQGEVTQNEPNCLTPRQRAEGYVLACSGRPLTDVTLEIPDPAGVNPADTPIVPPSRES
ncbi:2Fe-2S iron-sulfur cluster-binding protein [Streptomyces sp. NPDC006296]|uniref:2Fe-2S iron-sulfur cluster-binding protein n=1 Tax=Streptomyces sp. NPDC006296 TaxID=3156746 RepID=UPI0033AC0AB9